MFVVLFEVQPHPDLFDEYLSVATLLRPELEAVEGFIDNNRFESAGTQGRLLSLSTWRDEKSLIRWRTQATHYEQGQRRGRFEIFADYRLRVGEVTEDTHPPADISQRQSRYDETEIGTSKAATVLESTDAASALPTLDGVRGLTSLERYNGIQDPHRPLLLASWTSLTKARTAIPSRPTLRCRNIRIIREYGLHERREAPQYFPDVA